MAEKIGQILIRRGKITPAQLKEALRTQQFFGGYLGSHLINLGFVDEATLGESLSEIHRVPFAPFESIRLASSAAIKRLPPNLAQRFRVIPLQIEGNRLHLAMLNPSDSAALHEVSVATGLIVTAWVAPEYRILQALEKHYRFRRPSSAPIPIRSSREAQESSPEELPSPPAPQSAEGRDAQPDRGRRRGSPVGPVGSQLGFDGHPLGAAVMPELGGTVRPPIEPGMIPRSLEEWREEDERNDLDTLRKPQNAQPAPPEVAEAMAAPSPAARVHPTGGMQTGDLPPGALDRPPSDAGGEEFDLGSETHAGSESHPLATSPPASPHQSEPRDVSTGRSVCSPWIRAASEIGSAATRNDVVQAALWFLRQEFPRVVAFTIKDGRASVWAGAGVDVEELGHSSFDATSGIFAALCDGTAAYSGPAPEGPGVSGFYERLGGPSPGQVVLIPIHLRNRMVAFLYADGDAGPTERDEAHRWSRLGRMFSLGLEILLLRNKLRDLSLG